MPVSLSITACKTTITWTTIEVSQHQLCTMKRHLVIVVKRRLLTRRERNVLHWCLPQLSQGANRLVFPTGPDSVNPIGDAGQSCSGPGTAAVSNQESRAVSESGKATNDVSKAVAASPTSNSETSAVATVKMSAAAKRKARLRKRQQQMATAVVVAAEDPSLSDDTSAAAAAAAAAAALGFSYSVRYFNWAVSSEEDDSDEEANYCPTVTIPMRRLNLGGGGGSRKK